MVALKDVHRSDPVYLCGAHAAEMGLSPAADAIGVKSPEPVPGKGRSTDPAPDFSGVPHAQRDGRRPYILVMVAVLALAGGVFGLKLFRTIPSGAGKPAVVAEARKGREGNAVRQKAPRKARIAAGQAPSQAVSKGKAASKRNAQAQKPPLETARVAVRGSIARRVLPDVPKSASDTIRGTILVAVKVRVDALGNVARTELVFPGPSRYFARLAVAAARRWKFHPPVVAGRDSPSEWVIRFYYTRETTRADAAEDVRAETPRK